VYFEQLQRHRFVWCFFSEHSSAPSALTVAEIPSPWSVCFISFLFVVTSPKNPRGLAECGSIADRLELIEITVVALEQTGEMTANDANARHKFEILVNGHEDLAVYFHIVCQNRNQRSIRLG
jgi:hypothetical protein